MSRQSEITKKAEIFRFHRDFLYQLNVIMEIGNVAPNTEKLFFRQCSNDRDFNGRADGEFSERKKTDTLSKRWTVIMMCPREVPLD